MDDTYVKVPWPEYQLFMHREDIYYCTEDDTYFVPSIVYSNNMYDDETTNSLNPNKNERSN